jgi:hypothetical protein
VVNTTGTPFYQRQPLRDVVIWYGLSEGIHDGILKEVAGNIYGIDFQGNEKEYLSFIIEDFISPTILERLKQQNKNNPLFQPQIDDWRSMVDSIMIDTAYDGEVFNIALADVPAKKNDLVEGKYMVDVAEGARVAVKVTDMLGEEVLVVNEV